MVATADPPVREEALEMSDFGGPRFDDRELRRLEAQIEKLQGIIENKLDRLQQDFQRSALMLPEQYVPRREINERFSNLAEDSVRNRKDMEERRREEIEAVEERVRRIEESATWMWRAIVGALATGIIGTLIGLAAHGAGIK